MSTKDPNLWTLDHEPGEPDIRRKPFTDPFRYIPDILVRKAADIVVSRLASWSSMPDGNPEKEVEKSFAEGKMLGVLIVEGPDSSIGFITSFSGTVKGADGLATASVDGFVPPITDLTTPEGYFKREEAHISQISKEIDNLSSSEELKNLKDAIQTAGHERDKEIAMLQMQIRFSRLKRDEIRSETSDPSIIDELIKESQFQKAELKRRKDYWKETISGISSRIRTLENRITEMKAVRASMSENLQKWIFRNAIVHNAEGDSSSIWDIFAESGLVPPGGTGECAAPKLLEYAYRHGMKPVAMGEFWYGRSPETAVRTHGHFYPSCTSKCGPLLGFMMKGLTESKDASPAPAECPVIIYEDESLVIAEKPSGMPSVPGLDGRESLLEWLSSTSGEKIHSVHRLDMDTSGVMVYAKTPETAVNLQRQFEKHTVRKTYKARLSGKFSHESHTMNISGSISLPLSPDYDERPRQKADFIQGKVAYTEYEITRINQDGTADILLYPHTGRTHQLRVHCAHVLGLGHPIVGDLLYGSYSVFDLPEKNSRAESAVSLRLCLHALSITFRHPLTCHEMTFRSELLSY